MEPAASPESPAPRLDPAGVAWSVLALRLTLGLLFFMTGWFRIFELGAAEHARRFLVEPYAETWIPAWMLWTVGTSIPFVELGGGALVLAGAWLRAALLPLAGLLLVVTYGHLLVEPFWNISTHVLPRLLLIAVLLVVPREVDRYSFDGLRARS